MPGASPKKQRVIEKTAPKLAGALRIESGFTKILAWHERTQRDPGHRWVRSLIVETLRTLN